MSNDQRHDAADRLASLLMEVAGDQNVRALEAVAVALVNRLQQAPGAGPSPLDDAPAPGLGEAASTFAGERYELCRRIARRALRGTLNDLVAGASLFHRIDADPPWARRLLPVAVFGTFLFYRPRATGDLPLPCLNGDEHEPRAQDRTPVDRVLDVADRSRDHGGE